jgi:hypothetical protein
VRPPCLFQLFADAQRRIERRNGTLQDERHLAAAQRAQCAWTQAYQFAPVQPDASLNPAGFQVEQLQQGQRQCALSAAA